MADAITDIEKLNDVYSRMGGGEFGESYPLEMIYEVADDVYQGFKKFSITRDEWKDLVKTCKMPAPRMVLWCNSWRNGSPFFLALQSHQKYGPTDCDYISVFNCSMDGASFTGNILLGDKSGTYEVGADVTSRSEKDAIFSELYMVVCLLSLINQPQFTKSSPAGTRQQRRHAERKHNIPSERWRRIEWDLVKPKVQAGERVGSGRHMPLHFTRGHWRKALEHYDDVVQRNDGNWYKWINGYWSGHPAYGIVKSIHAPKVSNATKIMELAHG
jgi:hypothetical protein